MSHENIKGRFAPSPSGRMHLGNAYAAFLSWLSAKSKGGTWLLRIEDLDPQRCRMEYALQMEDDLRWLGFDWDEGGTEQRGVNGPYVQSRRNDIYEHYLSVLREKGITYPCHCTRAEIMATQAPHESDGRIVYQGTCRPDYLNGLDTLNPFQLHPVHSPATDGEGSTVRLYVPDREISFTDGHYGPQAVNLAQHCGDFALRRKDGAWAYQLAVVVDDALMRVTEVVRGRDLLLSSAQQIYLYSLLDTPSPTFIHHPLLCNDAGQRLCKRDKSMDMGIIRQNCKAEEIIGMLAFHAGITDRMEALSLREALHEFDWKKVPCQDIILVKK